MGDSVNGTPSIGTVTLTGDTWGGPRWSAAIGKPTGKSLPKEGKRLVQAKGGGARHV